MAKQKAGKKRSKPLSHKGDQTDSKAKKASQKPKHPDMEIPFLKNVLVLIGLFFLTYYLVGNVRGYKWLDERFIEGNLKKLEKFEKLTTDEKYQAYFRFNHQFMTFIRDNTADTAIVYMPPDSVIMPEDKKSAFYTKKRSNSVFNKVWATYFIYPRKLVYHRERDELEAFDRYTHVACVDGWGYEYLDYDVPKNRRSRYQVLPRTVEGLKEMNERNKAQTP